MFFYSFWFACERARDKYRGDGEKFKSKTKIKTFYMRKCRVFWLVILFVVYVCMYVRVCWWTIHKLHTNLSIRIRFTFTLSNFALTNIHFFNNLFRFVAWLCFCLLISFLLHICLSFLFRIKFILIAAVLFLRLLLTHFVFVFSLRHA